MDNTSPSPPNEDDDTSYPTSLYSGSVASAPKEVKEALARHAPDGERCLITRQSGVESLECCYLTARCTKYKKQRALEAAWGMEPGEFYLNDLQNMFWLRGDMRREFDQYTWFLLPTESDLQAVIDFNNRRAGQRASSHYRTVFPGQISWEYRFLPNNLDAPIFRLGNDPMDYADCRLHTPPYQNLSIVSHVDPFHIIYNLGEKVHKIKNPKPKSDVGYTLPGDPSDHLLLDKCEALYLSWVGSPLETVDVATQHSNHSNRPGTSKSQSDQNRETDNRHQHRNNKKDAQAQDFPQSGLDTAAPQGRNCTGATETTNLYLPAPEQSIHSADRKRQLKPVSSGTRNLTHHWTNIDDWVASVKFSALEKDPHSGGTERAKQRSVNYSHEEAREPPQGSWKEWIPEYELDF